MKQSADSPTQPAGNDGTDQAANPVFDRKFNFIPDIFQQWMGRYLDVKESTILDFGCGDGVMALGIASNLQAKRVVGVDVTQGFNVLEGMVQEQLNVDTLPPNLELRRMGIGEHLAGQIEADCIFTWSVFEHIRQDLLDEVVLDLRNVLRSGGYVFLQVSPLYYSANGSHFFNLASEPWAHLLLQHDALRRMIFTAEEEPTGMQLVEPSDHAGFVSYKEQTWNCYETLNRLVADDVIALFERHGFETLRDYRTNCDAEPNERLKRIYTEDVLKTEQLVALFRKV